ncbi:Melanin-concentrating hormone receptor [Heracleum sosnowskyi]|uniref:Melanin-concentrating hormone receptor n=1 Tax=Heracleum sosnowskyi TaxID=360622 RepID=A0AAD8GN38_9APIA|nr:Melanin-concentrating hormone receptor [Heracleum sosnowskyi]
MALNWLLHSAYNIVLGYPHVKTTKEEVAKSMSLSFGNNTKTDVSNFQMPLHYPRYSKTDYLKMEEWRVDLLLQQYGLNFEAKNIDEKRAFAMGAFLWPDQI